jgi:hypothetical protein
MVNDLQQVVLCVLENHEDAFAFQYYLDQMDQSRVAKLSAQGHLPDCGLRDTCILKFAFFVWFEFLDGKRFDVLPGGRMFDH